MSRTAAVIGILIPALLAALALPAQAEDRCETCGGALEYCAECAEADCDTNFIGVSLLADDLDGNRDSFDQYGLYPTEWATSGRVHFGADSLSRQRFEIRWQDVSSDDGRAWARLALWPLTLESDSFIIGGQAWDSFGTDPALIEQRTSFDKLRLRWHQGDLKPLLLTYTRIEFEREEESKLGDYTVERLSGQYNFGTACDILRGSIRQTGTSIDTQIPGFSNGRIDSTLVKLDAPLTDELDAYGRMTYSKYDYKDMPDSSMTAHDATLGLRYDPSCDLQLDARYRAKDNPDDNSVSSHVQSFSEYGLSVSYLPSDDTTIEAGYTHREVDYASLDMQDPAVFSLLRGSAVATPIYTRHATTVLTPGVDETWFDWRQCLGEDLVFSTRVDYTTGDNPGTELTAANSPGLFYDERLSRSHGLIYTVDEDNQLGVFVRQQEVSNGDRNSSFDQSYLEGSWTHCVASGRYLSLAYRDSSASLNVGGVAEAYTTDDKTYVATYSEDQDCFSYALNLSVSDGSGAEEYQQTGAGADLKFKSLGPVGMTIDWYDRSYTNFDGLDASALTVGLNYRIEF